jgi:hypothetical protein
MIGRLLYKFNSNTLCLAILLLLVIVSAIPVPSMVSFKSLKKQLSDSREELFVLKTKSTVVAENEKRILGAWRTTGGILEKRFEGLNSPLTLRNIVLDFSIASGLQPTLCFYRNEKRLISSEGLGGYGARSICTASVEIGGTGGLREILIFLTTIEDLQIGIRLHDLSIRRSDEFSNDFSFSMTIDGFYVCADESGISTLSGEGR